MQSYSNKLFLLETMIDDVNISFNSSCFLLMRFTIGFLLTENNVLFEFLKLI